MDDFVVSFVCVQEREKKVLVIIIKNQQYTSAKYDAYFMCHKFDENEHEHTTSTQCAMAMTTDLLWLHEFVQCTVMHACFEIFSTESHHRCELKNVESHVLGGSNDAIK